MTIQLPSDVEEELRDLALQQGRAVEKLVEDVVREYVEAAAITDVSPEEVAEAQMALAGELRDFADLNPPAKH